MPSASPPSRPGRRDADPQLRLTSVERPIDGEGEDLSSLRTRAAPLHRGPSRFTKGRALALLALSAVAAATTYTLVPSKYIGAVVLQVKPGKPVALQDLRTALMEETRRLRGGGGSASRWTLTSEWPVHVQASGSNRVQVSRDLVRLAALFPTPATPAKESKASDIETPLSTDPVAMLRQELTQSRERAENVRSLLQSENPLDERRHTADELIHAGSEVQGLRARLDSATRQLSALQKATSPEAVVIDPTRREKARAADVDVQQDAGELRVHMADGRKQLLEAWQLCLPALNALQTQAERVSQIDQDDSTFGLENDIRTVVDAAAETAGGYLRHIASFQRQWGDEFGSLEQHRLDAPSHDLLDVHNRLESFLGDFTFGSRQHLKQLENQVDKLSLATAQNAKYHEVHAELARGVRQLSTAQFHFERLAGQVRRNENLRLDAALEAAQNLYRRIEKRYAMIEDNLRREAAAELEASRKEEMEALSAELDSLRTTESELFGKLMASQDALLETQVRTDEQVRLETELNQTNAFADRLQGLLLAWEESQGLKGDATGRSALAESLTLQEIRLPDRPVNAQAQVASGGVAFVITAFFGFLALRHGIPHFSLGGRLNRN